MGAEVRGGVVLLSRLSPTQPPVTFVSTPVVTFSIVKDVHGTEHFLNVGHIHGYVMVLYCRTTRMPPKFWLGYFDPFMMTMQCLYAPTFLSSVIILIMSEYGDVSSMSMYARVAFALIFICRGYTVPKLFNLAEQNESYASVLSYRWFQDPGANFPEKT